MSYISDATFVAEQVGWLIFRKDITDDEALGLIDDILMYHNIELSNEYVDVIYTRALAYCEYLASDHSIDVGAS